jgi:cytochrome c oxidase assembly protein subunit 16
MLYRRKLASHPFLLFGLPFISLVVAASFLLTPVTALRYENHDRRNREVSLEDARNLGLSPTLGGVFADSANAGTTAIYNPRRRIIMKGGTTERDEYYVSHFKNVLGAHS